MSQLFTYESHQVRTITENGETWFVAKDVCLALGIGWTGATLKNIPERWRSMLKFNMEGRYSRRLVVISEPAVYKLAFRSNKPEADAFTNWVASEVLPAIRKTGKFEANNDGRTKPAQGELPPAPETPRKDKYAAYLEEVEAFRQKTVAGMDTLVQEGLQLVDVRKFGPGCMSPFTSTLVDWLQKVTVSVSPVINSFHTPERTLDYCPIGIIREMEKDYEWCRVKMK